MTFSLSLPIHLFEEITELPDFRMINGARFSFLIQSSYNKNKKTFNETSEGELDGKERRQNQK